MLTADVISDINFLFLAKRNSWRTAQNGFELAMYTMRKMSGLVWYVCHKKTENSWVSVTDQLLISFALSCMSVCFVSLPDISIDFTRNIGGDSCSCFSWLEIAEIDIT